ncbi:YdaS family helix-turn-helix protein [Marinicellulosiphila megalodicopiae]|uniref:YdaS family helix-turn-helix protein n=1 Tax=Marinicellulosiphila megalodicopiae TaxID=2724896 RepID=UPI003BAF1A81
MLTAIQNATEIIGGQTALANHLNIKQANVWNWLHVRGQAPAKYIKRISALTDNKVTVEELLADHNKE